jgi:3-oxoacyl-[acyl-carrier protein] reductase
MLLKNRVALITGSTGGGMGRSIAFTLARNGAHVVLNYGTNRRDAEADKSAEEVRSAVENLGVRTLLFKADTRNTDEVSAMVKQAVKELKKIDILVNNAGGAWNPKDITETPPEQFTEVIEAEINGAFNCIRECLPVMRKNRWGRIINIGAFDAGHWAAPGAAPVEYAIGKGARALLTRHLAFRERAHDITVNLINPGPGHTAHLETVEKALSFSERSAEWQKRAEATPQDVAEAVLFLCTEQARFITGSHIGFSIQ